MFFKNLLSSLLVVGTNYQQSKFKIAFYCNHGSSGGVIARNGFYFCKLIKSFHQAVELLLCLKINNRRFIK